MRIRGLKTARRAARWLRSRAGRSALILGYHRVATTTIDPFGICVSPDHFDGQLDALRQMADVIDLNTLRQGLQSGNLPKRAVAVTFDDGYQDNLTTALPLLAAQNIPATVFVVSGVLGQEFWWDRLARLIFETAVLPDTLTLQIGGEILNWSVMDDRYITWRKRNLSPRRRLFQRLYELLGQWEEQRPFILAQLQTWVESTGTVSDVTNRALTPDELTTLANHHHITIGAHTVTHPTLSKLPLTAQQEEIQSSKTSLEALLEQPVSFFSYPHGDSPPATQHLVQKAGYNLACTSMNNVARPHGDLFALPRFWPPDIDGDNFTRWLRLWLERP
jgi:peptidoglycan/xylan/chitin deacetylase (PgdA/CDA1 family)